MSNAPRFGRKRKIAARRNLVKVAVALDDQGGQWLTQRKHYISYDAATLRSLLVSDELAGVLPDCGLPHVIISQDATGPNIMSYAEWQYGAIERVAKLMRTSIEEVFLDCDQQVRDLRGHGFRRHGFAA